MKLYKEASLMMLPSSVKDGKLYSIFPQPKPLSGELVTNGDFNEDASWSKGTGCTISNGKARFTSAASGQGFTQSNFLTIGKIYKVAFTVSDYSEGSVKVRFPFNMSNTITANGSYVEYGEATTDDLFFQNVGTTTLSIDSVSAVEVDQLPADFDFTRGADRATRVTEQGLVRPVEIVSDELVQNGDFSNGSQNWTFSGGAELTEQGARINNTVTGANANILQSNSNFTQGKLIIFEYDVVATNGKRCVIEQIGDDIQLDTLTTGTNKKVYFEFDRADTNLLIKRAATGTDVTLDNISVVEVTEATDLPRLDWSGDCPVLLLEPQRTNLVTYSEDFSQWTNTGSETTDTPNSATSASGESNATKLQESDSSNGFHRLSKTISLSSATDYSLNIFAKKGTLSNIQVMLLNTTDSKMFSKVFDLENGTLGETLINGGQSLTDSKIEDIGNGWYRCLIVGQLSTAPNTFRINLANASTGNTTSNGMVEYTGDGNGNVYIYGAQLEEGSYPTSYIPTRGQAATRAKDTASIDLISKGITTGLTSATLLIEYEKSYSGDNLDVFRMQGTSDNGRAYIYETGNGFAADWNISGGGHTLGENTKVIWRLDSLSSGTMFKNGVKGNSGSGTAWSDIRYIYLNNRGTGGILKIKQIVLFPKVLSDNECINLTTI